ncbi:hypothetical protein J4Q44_G00344510 [Coregonus suidteri]|uniref:Uncharacterized protein n=1 Tax=Coregonus suidteri TaxID=861788 RepID=A0AAN8L0D4_9TELE
MVVEAPPRHPKEKEERGSLTDTEEQACEEGGCLDRLARTAREKKSVKSQRHTEVEVAQLTGQSRDALEFCAVTVSHAAWAQPAQLPLKAVGFCQQHHLQPSARAGERAPGMEALVSCSVPSDRMVMRSPCRRGEQAE